MSSIFVWVGNLVCHTGKKTWRLEQNDLTERRHVIKGKRFQ